MLKDRPDVVLKTIWENLNKMEKAGDARASEIKQRIKVVACGGDGTVTWVLKVMKDLELDPPPAVAIVPLGTGKRAFPVFTILSISLQAMISPGRTNGVERSNRNG